MCLSIVTKVWDIPLEVDKVGWKLFRVVSEEERVYISPFFCNEYFEIGKWTKVRQSSDMNSIPSTIGKGYPIGFHIYRDKEATKWADHLRYKVKRVRFRKVVARGIEFTQYRQKDDTVVVAQEVMILP